MKVKEKTIEAVDQDVLLATKFFAPPFNENLLARPTLMKKLRGGARGKITLVCAPAGFGKTTLLSEWQKDRALPICWLSLDENDNIPRRFWRYVIAALDTHIEGLANVLLPTLSANQPPPMENILSLMINELSKSANDVQLVLDDFHLIKDANIHEQLRFCLTHLPANIHLLLTSRQPLPFPTGKLQLSGQLTEILADDLRFDHDETRRFLERFGAANLPEEGWKTLDARLEGWPAGLQLLALSLQENPDTTRLLDAFNGSDTAISRYLAEEILTRLAPNARRFLLATGLLESLNSDLAAAVSGLNDCADILDELITQQMFLIPLDNQQRWYRYHHLFRDFLRDTAVAELGDAVREVHRRAVEWYRQNQMHEAAFHHAIEAADFTLAGNLLDAVADHLFMSSQIDTLQTMLDALPETEIRRRNNLAILHASVLSVNGDWVAFQERYKYLLSIAENEDTSNVDRANISIMQSIAARISGDLPSAIAAGEKAIALVGDRNDVVRSAAALILGLAHYQGGDALPALNAFRECMARNQYSLHENIDYLTAVGMAGDILFRLGKLRSAGKYYSDTISLTAAKNSGRLPIMGFIHMGHLQILYEWNQLDAAADAALTCRELAQFGGLLPVEFRSYIDYAKVLIARGDYSEAEAELARAGHFEKAGKLSPPQITMYQLIRSEFFRQTGDLKQAAAAAEKMDLKLFGEMTFLSEELYLARLRLAILLDQEGIVSENLPFLLEKARLEKRKGGVIRCLVLSAQYSHKKGQLAEAYRCLEEALALSEEESFLRVYLDEGAAVAGMLRQISAFNARRKPQNVYRYSHLYLNRIIHAFPEVQTMTAIHREIPGQASPLTRRESEVLAMIASGHSNEAIADQLCIAPSTLKTHINKIYSKLDIQSRSQAVLKAQALGLK